MNTHIEQALYNFRTTGARYARAERYYHGDHDLAFASAKFENTFGSLFREFALNLCPAICDAIRDRLKVEGFGISSPHVSEDFRNEEKALTNVRASDTIWHRNRMLAGQHSIGRSRILNRGQVLDRLPNVNQKGLIGGVLYYDGQFDDTRLLIDILRTAESHGAVVLNYTRVMTLQKGEFGKIDGVEFEDTENGKGFSASARVVVNATGAFCAGVQQMSEPNAKPAVTYSQGVHLVFDRKFLPHEAALLVPKTSDGRVLFCIPWKDHVLLGTTDTPVETPELEPKALNGETDFILETASEYLAAKPTRDDILSVFAGIRPLVKSGSSGSTASLSRGHHLFLDAAGLVTITGGKWTTYRQMAEDAIDKAIEIGALKNTKSETADLPIGPPLKLENGERLHQDLDITSGEVLLAVRDEMARTVEDILARRTRALFLDAKAAIEIAPRVGELMAGELGKDQERVQQQVEDFNKTAENYLAGALVKSQS